ncbi:hypothetical protein LCGC14_2571380, partial [marine sediment metagenome]
MNAPQRPSGRAVIITYMFIAVAVGIAVAIILSILFCGCNSKVEGDEILFHKDTLHVYHSDECDTLKYIGTDQHIAMFAPPQKYLTFSYSP